MDIITLLKKRLKLIFKLLVTIFLLVFLINYVSIEKILSAVNASNKIIILFVSLLAILNIYLQFLKWKVVCNSLLEIDDNKKIFKSLFYGFSAGIITPVRVGEYLGRKLAFDDQSILRVTVSTLIEKFASLYIILILGGIVSIFFINSFYSFYYSLPVLIFLIILIFLSFYILNGRKFSSKIFNKLSSKYKFFSDLKLEIEYVKKMDNESVKNLIRISVLFYIVIILQYALLAKAFDQTGDILLFMAAGSIILFIKSILSFLSFADLGIRESSSVFLLGKLGYSSSVGFNSAIFLYLFNLLLPSLAGLFIFLQRDQRKEQN